MGVFVEIAAKMVMCPPGCNIVIDHRGFLSLLDQLVDIVIALVLGHIIGVVPAVLVFCHP